MTGPFIPELTDEAIMIYKFGVLLTLFGILFLLVKTSQATEFKSGLIEGKLRPCPGSPNCVNSETSMINPIKLSNTEPKLAWTLFEQTITEQGGEIQFKSADYLSATFATPVFGFIDDVEARLDLVSKVIHLRSASRVGYYDFGANNRRLQTITKAMNLKLYNQRKGITRK